MRPKKGQRCLLENSARLSGGLGQRIGGLFGLISVCGLENGTRPWSQRCFVFFWAVAFLIRFLVCLLRQVNQKSRRMNGRVVRTDDLGDVLRNGLRLDPRL